MTFRGRTRTVVICLASLVAFGGIASVAIGGKKLKTKSGTVEIEGSGMGGLEDGTATARCPKKTKAVSGGFDTEIDDDLMGTSAILHIGSRRVGGRKWNATGINAVTPDGDLTAFAYCRKQKANAKSKTTEVEGTGGAGEPGDSTVSAKCEKGDTALSGGADGQDPDLDAPGTTAILPYESRKQGDRKWSASAINIGDTEGDLLGQVVCYGGKELKTKQKTGEVDASATTSSTGDIVARCSKKQRVVSGGFSSEDPIDPSTGALGLVYSSHKQGNRKWTISALSTGEDHDFTAFAYCEKKK
jgi:hypothetical protein